MTAGLRSPVLTGLLPSLAADGTCRGGLLVDERHVPTVDLCHPVTDPTQLSGDCSDPAQRVQIELDGEHNGNHAVAEHRVDNAKFGSLDVHLDDVDLLMPEAAGDICHSVHGRDEERMCPLEVDCGVRNVRHIRRSVEPQLTRFVPPSDRLKLQPLTMLMHVVD